MPTACDLICNLYSITKNQDAIRRMYAVTRDLTGNLPPTPGVFPDYPAPIVRQAGTERELTMARWGMPSSQKALIDAATKRPDKMRAKGKDVDPKEPLRLEPDSGATNIRNGWCSAVHEPAPLTSPRPYR